MQPRWLVAQLEELDYQGDFQIELITTLLFEAQALYRLTQDHLSFARNDVFAIHQLYESLMQSYQDALQQAKTRDQRVHHQASVVSESLKNSETSLNDARSLVGFWNKQAEKATNWQQRAYKELSRCEARRQEAESELSSATSELSRAQSDLNAKLRMPPRRVYRGTDRNGNAIYDYEAVSTVAEQNRVHHASARESRARSELNLAVSSYNRAQSEVTSANIQVTGSKKACSDADNAHLKAEQILEVANSSKRESQYSQTHSEECLSVLSQIEGILKQLKNTCEEQSQLSSSLANDANDAFILLNTIENEHESMQDHVFSLKYTLQDKVTLLLSFDQPINVSG